MGGGEEERERERERTETGIRNRPPFQTRPGKNTTFGHTPHSDIYIYIYIYIGMRLYVGVMGVPEKDLE